MGPRVDSLCAELREDTEHGASQLARVALKGLGELAGGLAARASSVDDLLVRLARAARQVAEARPAMAAIANGCARLFHAAHAALAGEEISLSDASEVVRRTVGALADGSSHAVTQIATAAAAELRTANTLLTLSESSTVLALLAEIAEQRRIRVITAESRPLLEGRNTASRAADLGFESILITDAALARYAPCADAALSGADTLLSDGSVVNKAGTCLLALAADRAGVPYFVLCESQKLQVASQPDSMSEQGPASRVWEAPPRGVAIWNPTFDCTPAELVTGVVTEEGVKSRAEIKHLSAEAAEQWTLLCRWAGRLSAS